MPSTALNPQLKEMYDKVMNTPVQSKASSSSTSSIATSPSVPPPASKPPAIPTNPLPPSGTPALSSVTPSVPAPSQPLSTQLPPMPNKTDKPFTYSVKKNVVERIEPTEKVEHHKKGIPLGVLYGGGLVFVVGYLVFWLKVLGFF